MLISALGLETARLISLCGAGGKTTLMRALAREYVAAGERVLVTTTTHMARSETRGPWSVVAAADAQTISAKVQAAAERPRGRGAGAVLAYCASRSSKDKLAGFAPAAVSALADDSSFDRILVEADGSARRPLKAPAVHEPALPAATDALVMVAGLNGLGRPLDKDTVFRPHIWAKLTGLANGAPVTAESLAKVVMHENGLARGCPPAARRILFANQTAGRRRLAEAGRLMASLAALPGRRPHRAVAGRLLPEPHIAHVVRFLPSPANIGIPS